MNNLANFGIVLPTYNDEKEHCEYFFKCKSTFEVDFR